LAKQHEADLSSALKKYHKVANKFPKFSGKLLTKINKIRNLSSAEKVLEQFDGLRSRYGKYRKEAGDPLNHASSDIKEIADRIQTFKKSLEKAKKAKVDN
jgi:DNA anti-recombination protein RmuC